MKFWMKYCCKFGSAQMLSIWRYNCMEQTSCKANISSVIEEIPRILWSQIFHNLVHQGHRLVPIMNQINLIHNYQSYSFKLHFNIILPFVAIIFFPLGSRTKTFCSIFSLPMPTTCPSSSSHTSWFDLHTSLLYPKTALSVKGLQKQMFYLTK